MKYKVQIGSTHRTFYKKRLFFWVRSSEQLKMSGVWYDECKYHYVACAGNKGEIIYKKGKSW